MYLNLVKQLPVNLQSSQWWEFHLCIGQLLFALV